MKYRHLFLSFVMSALAACGSSTATTSSVTGEVSVSATVDAALADYTLALYNNDTEELVTADITDDGTVSADVDGGTYTVSLLNEENTLIALLVQDSGTAFAIDSDTDLGTLSVDEDSATMISNSELAVASLIRLQQTDDELALDLYETGDVDAALADAFTDPMTTEDSDDDSDGIPDFFDIDGNGDGIYDVAQGGISRCAKRVVFQPAAATIDDEALDAMVCRVFNNLKLPTQDILNGDGSGYPHTESNVITVELIPGTALEGSIHSVEIISSPSYNTPSIAISSGGFVANGTYPTGDLWDDHNRELFDGTNAEGDEVWTVWASPHTDPHPLQFFVFRVTFTSGLIVDCYSFLHFIYHTPPKVQTIDSDLGTTTLSYPTDEGSFDNPITIDGDVTMRASRALEVISQNEICGLNYRSDIFFYDDEDNMIGLGTIANETADPASDCDPSILLELNLTETSDLPDVDPDSGEPISKWCVDFTTVDNQGDNSAQKVCFVKP